MLKIFKKKKDEPATKKKLIVDILDDLTHLEINTIIKKGMVASPAPETVEELAKEILDEYKNKLSLIIKWEKDNNDDFVFDFEPENHISYENFRDILMKFTKYLDEHDFRIDERDFIVILRMKSFCAYLKAQKTKLTVKNPTGKVTEVSSPNLYNSKIEDILSEDNKINATTRQQAKLKRIFDLGTETIVMQTRFGIDGDVVTRIEESFANKPSDSVLDLHKKHTDMSLTYWKFLINIAVDLVGRIFDGKNKQE